MKQRVPKQRTLKLRTVCGGFVLIACGLATFAAGLPARPSPAAPQAGAFTADKGKLRITQAGVEAGTEQFDLTQSGSYWVAHGETVLKGQGSGEVRSTGQLRLNPDGTPVHYDWSAQAPNKVSGAVDFSGGTAKTSVNVPGKAPIQQDFKFESPRVVILDNNLYDQYAVIGRLYDWNAKGTQTFPVLIPQDTIPGSIMVEPADSQSAGGGSLEGLRVKTADLEVEVYFDAKRRLMRLEVPDAKVVVTRE